MGRSVQFKIILKYGYLIYYSVYLKYYFYITDINRLIGYVLSKTPRVYYIFKKLHIPSWDVNESPSQLRFSNSKGSWY